MSNFAWWYYSLGFICACNFQWPWPYCKVTAVSNSFNWKICVLLIQLRWNCVELLSTWSDHESTTIFYFCTHSRKIMNVFPDFTQKFNICSFTDTVEVSFFFQNLHGYNHAWGLPMQIRLMTLTLFEGHRCVRIINCNKKIFLDSCSL